MAASPDHSIQTSLTDPLQPCQQAEPCEGARTACGWGRPGDGWPFWMRSFGFTIFVGICGTVAIYHSGRDPWATTFVLATQIITMILLYALRAFETQPRGAPKRARAKAAAWVLSTILTLIFALRVAELVPLPAAVLVWVMAGSTVSAWFYTLFVCPDGGVAAEEESPEVTDMA